MPFLSPENYAKQQVAAVQEYSLLAWRALRNMFSAPRYWADIYTQMDSIGFGSLPIVILTGFFTGCVLALQSSTALERYGQVGETGTLVALGMVKELGPVLTGLMVSGRNASGMASELGSMKVTEQIDAMRALGTDPVRKLVTPRVVATIVMLFFLTVFVGHLRHCRWQHREYPAAAPEGVDVLSYRIPGAGVCGRGAGPGQATLLRLHHRQRGMLLRHDDDGRDAGRGPVDDAGGGGVVGVHHFDGLHDQQIDDRHLRQVTSMAHAQIEREPLHLNAGEPLVVFDEVSIHFEEREVLKSVSFTVQPGETRIILGPAGGGKSVLMKLANGLIEPDEGTIWVFGERVDHMQEVALYPMRAHVGMVFQESALFDSLTVRDNVGYRLEEEHVDRAEIEQRVREALRFVELEQAIDKFPSELSGGMRRRVSIARAIISRPDLILYDSPTGGLDPITSTTIIELVMKQRDVSHTTALLITHRLQDAFTLATHRFNTETGHMEKIPNGGVDEMTKFLVLNEGRVVFDGSTLELVRTKDPWLREYLTQ